MVLVDVNVLLYAFDRSSPSHRRCLRWLEEAGGSDQVLGICSQMMASVLRIATHPAIYARPETRERAIEFLEDVRNLPAFRFAEPGPGHWPLFSKLVLEHRLLRGGITDGWLAALALELDATLVSTDAGFRRFRGLRVVNPLQAPAPSP